MLPIIQILGRPIQTSLLILLVAFSISVSVLERSAALRRLSSKEISNLAYRSLILGIVGARLGYVIQYWSIYREDLASIVALSPNGLSPTFGCGAALIPVFLYIHHKKIPVRPFLDILTPAMLVLAGGLALADLASGNGYGLPTQLPWAIRLWGELRHPTQLYDLVAVALIGFLLWRWASPFTGAQFGIFVTLYAASRLFLEMFHADSQDFLGLRIVQLWSLCAVILGIYLLHRWASDSEPKENVTQSCTLSDEIQSREL